MAPSRGVTFCALALPLARPRASTPRPETLQPQAMTTSPEDPFEKTFRLVCRLDDSEIDSVRDTAEWIARCVQSL